MKPVSIAMQERNDYEPDPETLAHWFNLPATKHHLYKLKLTHQEALEDLARVYMGNSYDDQRAIRSLQASCELLNELINGIENMNRDAERDNEV